MDGLYSKQMIEISMGNTAFVWVATKALIRDYNTKTKSVGGI